jgi:predicted acetyltransferase
LKKGILPIFDSIDTISVQSLKALSFSLLFHHPSAKCLARPVQKNSMQPDIRTVFIVHHEYEKEGCDRIKHIGVFLTRRDAETAVEELSHQPGFRSWPDGFVISEEEPGEYTWKEGFGASEALLKRIDEAARHQTIELTAATAGDIPALRRLMQFYLYDFAAFDGWDIGDDGTYGNLERIERFWEDGDYERFLIRVDGVLAGFALTCRTSEGDETIHLINEFFVLRRYRRCGVGRVAAQRLFERFDGTWELSVMNSNAVAKEFWAAVIGDLTGKGRSEFSRETEENVIFRFRASN